MAYVYSIAQVDELESGGIRLIVYFWQSIQSRRRRDFPIHIEDFIIMGFVEDDWDIEWEEVDLLDDSGNVIIDEKTGLPEKGSIEKSRTPVKRDIRIYAKNLIDKYAEEWKREKRKGIKVSTIERAKNIPDKQILINNLRRDVDSSVDKIDIPVRVR